VREALTEWIARREREQESPNYSDKWEMPP